MARVMRSKRITLLQMLTNFHIGGTERQVANLALGIDSSHFDLHLACLDRNGASHAVEENNAAADVDQLSHWRHGEAGRKPGPRHRFFALRSAPGVSRSEWRESCGRRE